MNKILNIVLVCVILLITIFPISVKGQLQNPIGSEHQIDTSSKFKAYSREFLASEFGLVGGSAIAAGLMVTGILNAFAGNGQLAASLLIGGLVTGLSTPVLMGLLMHRTGKKYDPSRKLGFAILGSFVGTVTTTGILQLMNFTDSRPRFLTTTISLIVPSLIGVIVYNAFPKSKSIEIGKALINKSNGTLSPGIPFLSLVQNPINNDLNLQLSLLRVRF